MQLVYNLFFLINFY